MKDYASFFEWHNKGQKELGVVEELLVALNRAIPIGLHSPREAAPDPPDCICLDALGRTVAIEVTEVVCQAATRLHAKGPPVYRGWQPGELVDQVASVLKTKDRKNFHGGPFHAIIACLFTDEPALTVAQATSELSGQLFGPFAHLTAAYLLFSYDPGNQSYPLIKLSIRP